MFMCGTIVRIATRNRMDLNFNDNSEIATILHWRRSRHIDKLHNFKIHIVNQHLLVCGPSSFNKGHKNNINWNGSLSLPSANEVWGKVIFSEACVKNSVRGGVCSSGVPGPGGSAPGGVPGGNPPDGYYCERYASYWNAFLLYLMFK